MEGGPPDLFHLPLVWCFPSPRTTLLAPHQALDLSAVETLIVYEDLDVMRYEIKHPATGGTTLSPLTHPCVGVGWLTMRCLLWAPM